MLKASLALGGDTYLTDRGLIAVSDNKYYVNFDILTIKELRHFWSYGIIISEREPFSSQIGLKRGIKRTATLLKRAKKGCVYPI